MAENRQATDDAGLVREVVAGSQDALAEIYDRHVDAVYATASRLTSDRQVAEEVVQETFLALWNRAELFDPKIGSLAAWLHTIARNRTVDRLRAAGRRPNLIPLSSAAGEDEQDSGRARPARGERDACSAGRRSDSGPRASSRPAELRQVLRDALGGAAGSRSGRPSCWRIARS